MTSRPLQAQTSIGERSVLLVYRFGEFFSLVYRVARLIECLVILRNLPIFVAIFRNRKSGFAKGLWDFCDKPNNALHTLWNQSIISNRWPRL